MRDYNAIDMPELEFCPECEEKVRNNRTDICTECRQKKQEYEIAYHCIVDLGMIGAPGRLGEERLLRGRVDILKERYKKKRGRRG